MSPSWKLAAIAAGTSVSMPLPPAPHAESPERQHKVSLTANVGDVQIAGPVVLGNVREPLAYAVAPHVTSLQRGLLGLEPNVGVIEAKPALHVICVERLGCLAKEVEHLGALGKPLDVRL
jgi:hypothetical protein